ncbi:MAG: YwaF family protein, partial [Bacilli bacterium]|nr:YwaF family protein [Bacilli bacterium]
MIAVLIIIGVTILVSIKFKDCSYKTYKIIMGLSWGVCLIMEILKQLVLSYNYGNPSYFYYDFYNLPFHLCSTIYYIVPILLLINKEKNSTLNDALTGFMCFFVLYAGLAVVFYNDIVMSDRVYTNFQTMAHPGIQVVLGVFMFVWNRKSINFKTFLRSLIVLAIFTTLAIIVNISLYNVSGGIDMFYVNPYEVSVIPVINAIHENVGFIPYLIVYLICVVALGLLTYLLLMLFIK